MNRSQEIAVTIVGAVIGGAAAFVLFTERGRTMRRQIEPALEDVSRELMSVRDTVRKAAGAAHEGWTLLTEALGEEDLAPSARYRSDHPAPFKRLTYVR